MFGNTVFRTYDPLSRVTAEWGATYPVRYVYRLVTYTVIVGKSNHPRREIEPP